MKGEVSVEVVSDRGATLLTVPHRDFWKGGTRVIKTFLEANKGDNYGIIIRNQTPERIGVVVAVIVGIRWWYGTTSGRTNIDRLLLRMPIVGILIRKVAVAKFTRTLGTLISSGVAILDGLDITARTAGNKIVEMAVLRTRASIAEGKTIAEPLRESGVFPPMVVQMIAVGEQTGALDAMLGKIADFYDEEVDTAVANLTSLLEPLLMVFLGVVVGGVVIAMYLPIFKLVTVVGK